MSEFLHLSTSSLLHFLLPVSCCGIGFTKIGRFLDKSSFRRNEAGQSKREAVVACPKFARTTSSPFLQVYRDMGDWNGVFHNNSNSEEHIIFWFWYDKEIGNLRECFFCGQLLEQNFQYSRARQRCMLESLLEPKKDIKDVMRWTRVLSFAHVYRICTWVVQWFPS